jgi:hypothetical protein
VFYIDFINTSDGVITQQFAALALIFDAVHKNEMFYLVSRQVGRALDLLLREERRV